MADGSRGDGLGIPSPLAVLLGVYVLPETYSLGFFWSGYASVLGVFRQRIQFMCQSSVALVVISGGTWILRLILGRSRGFPVSPSCSAATGSVSLLCEGVQEPLDLLGDGFRNFRIAGMLRVPFGRRLAPVAWQHDRYGPEGQYYSGYGSGTC